MNGIPQIIDGTSLSVPTLLLELLDIELKSYLLNLGKDKTYVDISIFLEDYFKKKLNNEKPELFQRCVKADIAFGEATIRRAIGNKANKAKYQLLDFICYVCLRKTLAYIILTDYKNELDFKYTIDIPEYAEVEIGEILKANQIQEDPQFDVNPILFVLPEQDIEQAPQSQPTPEKEQKQTAIEVSNSNNTSSIIPTKKPHVFGWLTAAALLVLLIVAALIISNFKKNQVASTNPQLTSVDSLVQKKPASKRDTGIHRADSIDKFKVSKADSTIDHLGGTVTEKSAFTSIKIGKQIWMSKNVDVDHYADGTKIPEAKTDSAWIAYGNKGIGCWCYYENNKSNEVGYGKLYNWYAALDSTHGGLLSDNWRLPTDDDIENLVTELGVESKYSSYLHPSYWPNAIYFKKNNWSILGGCRTSEGQFTSRKKHGYWWINIKLLGPEEGYPFVLLNNSMPNIRKYYRSCGFSVRGVANKK